MTYISPKVTNDNNRDTKGHFGIVPNPTTAH